MNIIVTGGIGSGKSTFTKMLMAYLPGYTLYDIDAKLHALYENPNYTRLLEGTFGFSDRPTVSDHVFKDPEARKWLEDASKEYLKAEMNQVAQAGNVVFDFPLYFEHFDVLDNSKKPQQVIAVHCSPKTQLERIMERGRFTAEKAQAILANQYSRELKIALSDLNVDTDCTLEAVEARAKEIATNIKIAALEQRCKNLFDKGHIWNSIEYAYSGPFRAYHGLNHLVDLFEQYDQVRHLIHNRRAVEIAIWFHDYVYSTGDRYSENESRSAAGMWEELSALANRAPVWQYNIIQDAAELILCTKGHKITSPYILARPELLSDAQHFLDIDLSGLGNQNFHIVKAADLMIRKEFREVPDLEFAKGRIKAMEPFLKREKLYQSETFAHLEPIARKNLEQILQGYRKLLETSLYC